MSALCVSAAVTLGTGMYKVKRVRAHTTTNMLVYLPERGRGPLWSTWMTLNGRDGVAMGVMGALVRLRERTLPHVEQALAYSWQSRLISGH